MKKTMLILLTTIVTSGVVMMSCDSSEVKAKKAAEKVQVANAEAEKAALELKNAEQVLIDEYNQFKKESEAKIIAHNKSVAEFRKRVAKEKKENRAKYEAKLTELENKNSDLKKKLDGYKADGIEKWNQFKNEFNRDMEALGKSFSDLTVKNVK
jgi:peptidyl-tRNA hydrolase